MEKFIRQNTNLLFTLGIFAAGFYILKKLTSGVADLLPFGNTQTTTNADSIRKQFEHERSVKAALNPRIKGLAEQIYSALRGYGTDEAKIFNVFAEVKTAEEIKALYIAYGRRATYDSWDWFGFASRDLVQALREDLEISEFNKIKPKLALAGLA